MIAREEKGAFKYFDCQTGTIKTQKRVMVCEENVGAGIKILLLKLCSNLKKSNILFKPSPNIKGLFEWRSFKSEFKVPPFI